MYPTHLNTLFVLTESSRIKRDGKALTIETDEGKKVSVPIHAIESLLCLDSVWISPPAMGLCVERGVTISFVNHAGYHLANVTGKVQGSVLTRHTQMNVGNDPIRSLALARDIVDAKLHNSRSVLQRFNRDHKGASGVEGVQRMERAIASLQRQREILAQAQSMDELRGMEGVGAAAYFGAFGTLILPKDVWSWQGREMHPAPDPLNSLLSFLYALLRHDCESAAVAAGLDPEVGFLHTLRSGRCSLALDLMEPFRSILADRVALDLLNRKQVQPKDFTHHPGGAVTLTDTARRTVIQAWQERKQEEIRHPVLNEKMPWKLVLHIEARLLSRYLREGGTKFPAFKQT